MQVKYAFEQHKLLTYTLPSYYIYPNMELKA